VDLNEAGLHVPAVGFHNHFSQAFFIPEEHRIYALPAVPKRSQVKQGSLRVEEEAVNDLLYRSFSASSGCTIRKWRWRMF
jgi:hypothetical protein